MCEITDQKCETKVSNGPSNKNTLDGSSIVFPNDKAQFANQDSNKVERYSKTNCAG